MNDSLQVRRTAIAYLYQGVPDLERKDNLAFYDEITRQGVDLPELLQQPQGLVLSRRGSGGTDQVAEVRIGPMRAEIPGGAKVNAALRCLIAETGPRSSPEVFKENADLVHGAFNNVWGARVGRVQLVEVSIAATIAVSHGTSGASGFLKDRCTRVGDAVKSHLGREFNGFAVSLTSTPIVAFGPDPLVAPLIGANVDLRLEPFVPDEQLMLITVMVKWPLLQFRLSEMPVPQELREKVRTDYHELNMTAKQPAEYVIPAWQYLERNVVPFLSAVGR
jgi:hypothetical protein